MNPTDQPTTPDETSSPSPCNVSVSPEVFALATNPPPRAGPWGRREFSQALFERALDTKVGDTQDSRRLVYIAARLAAENSKDPLDQLTFTYLYEGERWPVAVRAVILASLPWAFHLESRLAAVEERCAKVRQGKRRYS